MIKRKILLFVMLSVLAICLSSCMGRRQSPPGKKQGSDQESEKGYIIFINAESPGKNTLYSVGADGKNKKKIYDKNPYSAAGYNGKIAFLSDEKGSTTLYMVNGDSSSLTPVIKGAKIKTGTLSWSQDGSKIIFIAKMPDDTSEQVYYVEAGKNMTPERVTSSAGAKESPRFSKDLKSIVYTGNMENNYEIYRHDLSSRIETNLTKSTANDISPALSPDGMEIFFLSDEKAKGQYNLYSMDLDGGSRTELTTGLNIERNSAKVSTDSSMISFITSDPKEKRSLQVMDMRKSTIMIANDAYISAWSSDSKILYYGTFDPKNRKIMEYDFSGKSAKDAFKLEYKPGEESTGLKFLHFTDKLKPKK